ncbi:Uncharacterised protein [uncultured archaeon]|nr:Uncharacterised protein [uncultured archaeon]
MDRSDLLKLLVVFIAVIFVLSMFSQFGKGNQSGTTTGNTTATVIGMGTAKCKIVAFSAEMTIDPWTNGTAAIAESLKAQKKIDYVNLVGKRGVLILPSGGNISDVRAAFMDIGASATADASCSVTEVVNFTLQNGTTQPHAPGSVRLSLDPFSRVGDELSLDITADISDTGITNMKATAVPDVEESATTAAVECSDNYMVDGAISWGNRSLNISSIASELNISPSSISYTRNDTVGFSRTLTSEEIAELNASILTDIMDETVIRVFTDKFGNVTPTFPYSPITVGSKDNASFSKAIEFISSKGAVITELRGCTLTIDKTMEVNGKQMLVSSGARQMDYFLNAADVPGGSGNLSIFGNASHIGRIVTGFDMIGTR